MQKIFNCLNRRAFTLAELMAVVVIIAILAGIALGSYRRSIDRAKFTDARSLAHQVAAARDVYYYDHLYDGSGASMPTLFSLLPLEVEAAAGSSYTINDFTIDISSSRYVRVQRVDRSYGICVYQEANAVGKVPEEKCLAFTADGQDFCKSLGYANPVTSC